MTHVRNAIAYMKALAEAGLAKPPLTQPELRRQLAKLDATIGEAEPAQHLRPFLQMANQCGADSLSRFQLNRVLRGAWCDAEFDALGLDALTRSNNDPRRSSDQAVIDGYLTYYPVQRPVIASLASAAEDAANRHEWAWRKRAQRWELFRPQAGPSRVARDLIALDAENIGNLLYEIGLGSNLATSAFGRAVFAAFCMITAELPPQQAVVPQGNLLRLFDNEAFAGQLDLLARALLEPWLNEMPELQHRKAISGFLLDQIGDPRLHKARWDQIARSLAESIGEDRARDIPQVFKRWLTEVAMREFFRAIAKTTDRRDQWAQREKFWLAYLEAGVVSDAWPALGIRARNDIESIIRQSGERPGYAIIRGGPQSSSSIIMRIGDLRIAEWSDNGACRFWSDTDPKAPNLYARTYDGNELRTTNGRSDFEYEAHIPASPGWESKFAEIIYRRTSIPHPKFGQGRKQFAR